MPTLWGHACTRSDLLRRAGDLRQLAGAQPIELSDGRERGRPRPVTGGVEAAHPAYAEHRPGVALREVRVSNFRTVEVVQQYLRRS